MSTLPRRTTDLAARADALRPDDVITVADRERTIREVEIIHTRTYDIVITQLDLVDDSTVNEQTWAPERIVPVVRFHRTKAQRTADRIAKGAEPVAPATDDEFKGL